MLVIERFSLVKDVMSPFCVNDSIASLCVREKTGTSEDKFPYSIVFLLKDKPEA